MVDKTMKSDNLRLELVSGSESETPPESPLRILHRALRGRYGLAAIVALLLAAICSIVGFNVTAAKYRSSGLVHVEAVLPTILYPTQENQVPPMFDAYVAGQQAYLQSGYLLAEAVERPELREAGWPSGPRGVSALSDAVSVSRARGEHTIVVTVTHREPRMAQAGVNAILAAYAESDPDPGGLSLAAKERVLVQREHELETQLEVLRLQMLEVSDQYGADAVQRIHAGKVDELMQLDRKLEEIQLARRNVEAGITPGDIGGVALRADSQLSPLKSQELAVVAEIESLQYAPGHPVMRELQRQLDAIRIQMQLRQRVQTRQANSAGDNDAKSPMLMRLDQFEAGYVSLRDRLRQEAATLGRQRIALSAIGEKTEGISVRLKMTRNRLDEIRFEAGRENADRVSIIAGGLPGLPSRDRRAGLAGAGALFGAAAGVALIALLGMLDQRVRYLDQLEAMNLPVTVVPSDPDRLRHSIQLRGGTPGSVHAVVSCANDAQGVNLASMLAVSYADAGYKTLLIDADLVVAQITDDFDLAEEPGLRDAIGAGRGVFHPTSNANLWAMPVGSIDAVTPKEFNRESIKRLYDDLRPQFDAVIIDAGVIRSALEACLVTAESDHVLLNVQRNQRGEHVRSTVAQLGLLRVDDASLVFEPVTLSDVRPYHKVETQQQASPVVGVIRPDERKRAA